MDFKKVIEKRDSIRKFKNKKVSDKKIESILKLVSKAPSAGNLQAYEIVAVKNKNIKEMLSIACYSQECVKNAPVVLVFLADAEKSAKVYGTRGKELYFIQDADIACTYAMLSAVNFGLSSVWIGAFDEERVKKILNAGNLKPIAILPIGFAGEIPKPTGRRNLEEFVHKEIIREN